MRAIVGKSPDEKLKLLFQIYDLDGKHGMYPFMTHVIGIYLIQVMVTYPLMNCDMSSSVAWRKMVWNSVKKI